LHANALYVGSRDDRYFGGGTVAHVEMPPYGKVDLSAEYAIPRSLLGRSDLTLSARADNVFDSRYEAIAGFRSPGRLVTVGARLAVGGRGSDGRSSRMLRRGVGGD
jgi:outer membrane cobalamin receptor